MLYHVMCMEQRLTESSATASMLCTGQSLQVGYERGFACSRHLMCADNSFYFTLSYWQNAVEELV